MSVRRLLRSLAQRALQTPQLAGPEHAPERLDDALAALRLLMDNWDDLIRAGGTSRGQTPAPASRASRRQEVELLALLSAHQVVASVAGRADLRAPTCRCCGLRFEQRDDVLIYSSPPGSGRAGEPTIVTHLRCRWWWWESPDSPIRPPR